MDTQLQTTTLLTEYRNGTQTPVETVETVYNRLDTEETNAWISIREKANVLADARSLDSSADQPLYGIPFAIKDNIDYAGLPTTAGCPAYAYDPETHATVVDKLLDAGALLIGKTNMDQFATGLVGTRSPYGACTNVHNSKYMSGGSSSGSAVAVARGDVAFALGTDTAGSGRVPAAVNGIIGVKPSRGMVSTSGVVPACASLDCVSIFASTCPGALHVESVIAGYDRTDPYSKKRAATSSFTLRSQSPTEFTIGLPATDQLEFYGDDEAAALFGTVRRTIQDSFPNIRTIDFEPFIETAQLLYDGPWLAERLSAIEEFVQTNADAMDPVVAEVVADGHQYSAIDAFHAFHELEALKQECAAIFEDIDVLVTPTTGTVYTTDEIAEAPIERNSNLGYYTNYVNLLDLAAISVPTGSFDAGPGFGVTVLGEACQDDLVAMIGDRLQSLSISELSASNTPTKWDVQFEPSID